MVGCRDCHQVKPIWSRPRNIRTLNQIGKLELLEQEMTRMRLGCLGLSETRWTGKGHICTENGNTLIISGHDRKKQYGVGMLLDKERSKTLLGYNPISERILTVKLAGKPYSVTLIQIYAPTNQAPENQKEAFYSCLQQVYSKAPKGA